MGRYLNPTNVGFQKALKSSIYVDKTGMIENLNQMIGTSEPMLCVSRPRRFGKSTAVNMLTAYYSRGCESKALFEGYEISKKDDFETHLNQYDVIRMDMQLMLGEAKDMVNPGEGTSVLKYIRDEVTNELNQYYPGCDVLNVPLSRALWNVYEKTGKPFIVIIDEWDCVFRNYKDNQKFQKDYIEFLRGLFKGVIAEECIALAYLTGILPIKKYGTESALNNFKEFTMVQPDYFAEYVGFTENEVAALCERYGMDLAETKRWYDGYLFEGVGHIYSPRSVVEAMKRKNFGSYWTSTETYESLRDYISMNFQGLKESVIQMLAGQSCEVDSESFANDMVSFENKDDVLILLVHLGYLAYDFETQRAFIPNEEVRAEFTRAVKYSGWQSVMEVLAQSESLIQATQEKDAEKVADILEQVHADATSILNYNDENSLSCVIGLAYYTARKEYFMIREMPSGKGYADIVFLPRKNTNKPAMIIELKWDKTVESAIAQIKDKRYVQGVENYTGKILLVGISYDKETKKHQCMIEEYIK